MRSRTAVFAGLLSSATSSPLREKIDSIKTLLQRDVFEWTALGDSYSSGVGSGDYVSDSYRCLRYDKAYPVLISQDARLPSGDHLFNNVVCSGADTAAVEAYQFYDKDTSGQPNWQYGTRPRFGDAPSMATLSVGGNDINFPGIIFNCILDTSIPGGGIPKYTCDEQKKITWDKLIDPALADRIDGTIKKVLERGRKGPSGDKFKLYLTGFPQFFSAETDECDSVTFARTANPKPDGKEHTMMTQANRKEFNAMSIQLNKAIAEAASRHSSEGVKFVPIDDALDGHRFCEPGVKEPNQQNPKLWMWHYPYNEPENKELDNILQDAYNNMSASIDVAATYPAFTDFQNALFDAIKPVGDPQGQGAQDVVWRPIGNRVKVFHPQVALHEVIRDKVLDTYIGDLGSQTSLPAGTPSQDQNVCHGVSGDYWIMSRDVAVDNAKAFCAQDSKTVTYNAGSVNELELSVRRLGDNTKTPHDAPDCVGRIQAALIDGCDGNDPVNNPHNYKFGATLTTADGWEYKLTPLSKQVNEVSCDVSYKFLWDAVEIRGKNLPDAKLGANGEGLHDALSGCGALTSWNFERTPGDVKFQWYATCSLPIGTKSCVGDALLAVGGADTGNCHGAGKRAVDFAKRREFGIEDWPGYGDDEKHVFPSPSQSSKRDSIDAWPGYGDDGRHVFKHAPDA
ncbi:hypothetical protein B0A48_00913 [Cryoendolithus antarcticus]|uniref:Uncharacterized protein n=1 Tax=Cryoendolithus antarcticus TaxID=1507870 RepID=A0A1V8TRP7_9PEZI|nr:hypothetical protein B0A48_00913 [Cryoendolithus antarcticus]